MAITVAEAKTHLNIPQTTTTHDVELDLFVDAANEWIAAEVTDDTTAVAQLATRILVAHWWRTQRGPAGAALEDGGDSRGAWFSIPPDVRELLQEKHTAASTPQGSFPDAIAWPDPVEYTT